MTRVNIGAWIKRDNAKYHMGSYRVKDLGQCARVKPWTSGARNVDLRVYTPFHFRIIIRARALSLILIKNIIYFLCCHALLYNEWWSYWLIAKSDCKFNLFYSPLISNRLKNVEKKGRKRQILSIYPLIINLIIYNWKISNNCLSRV